jgi:hypothetical protein
VHHRVDFSLWGHCNVWMAPSSTHQPSELKGIDSPSCSLANFLFSIHMLPPCAHADMLGNALALSIIEQENFITWMLFMLCSANCVIAWSLWTFVAVNCAVLQESYKLWSSISYLFLWQLLALIVVCDITEFGKTVENNIGEVLLHCCICFGSIRVDSDMLTKKLDNLINYQDISHFAFSPHYQISYYHPICAVLLSNIHKM